MQSQITYDLRLFETFPGLLLRPPRLRMLDGSWVIEWSWVSEDTEVVLVLHAYVKTQPLWSYSIYDTSTNTVRHYLGRDADIEKDRLMKIEQGRPPT